MKRKVNLNRPEISSAEIAKRKDFDSVLKQSASVGGKPLIKKPWFLSSVVAVTIAIVATVVLLNQNTKTDLSDTNNQEQLMDSVALQAFYKAEEAKPCIAPPIKGLNVTYTTYTVIAEKGANLDYKTGSKITIPKNAFTDKDGKLITGEVELRYRELHDAFDFFVSGIPMTYDSAGVKYQFESAGMIEVLAYQNGEMLTMAPKKEIAFEMASDYDGEQYNFYKLDTLANNWSCLGKDKVVAKKDNSSNFKDTIRQVPIQEKIEYKTLETKKIEAKKEKEVQVAALPKTVSEPVKPAPVKKGKYTFNIEVDAKEFPELSIYKGLLFEVGDENANFNKAMYDVTWDEATVKEGAKAGVNYNLTLVKGLKKYELVVYPVFEGKNYETALATYQEKFNKYKLTLDKRIAEEERIEEIYQAKVAEFKKQQEAIVKANEERAANLFKQMETTQKVMRSFTVSSFGVFNCDNPSAYPTGVLCTATIKNDLKKDLMCYDVYLVDKEKNGLFTYYKNPVTRFSFNPKSKNMLWTVENGILYWLKPEQFNSINGGTKEFVMNKVDQKFETVEEMKAYFNF
ncbi:MAG: hypothetical protein IPP64_04855 [Bacteroidetes bacterium]|nr:hypothetical protein [Bacteroidota bacterium]